MRILTLAFCGVLFSTVLFGQAGTGSITGTVTDPGGASVPNVPVEVKNSDTNVRYPTVTTNTGTYNVTLLPPGPYSVTVTAPGFKKLTRAGISVDAGQILPLDLGIEVGASSESVTVTAEATLLKADSGDVSHNITLAQLDELPILGIGTANAGSNGIRNPYNSAVFLPGVSYFANFNMIVNGAPTNTAAYRIEGLDNTNHTVAFAIMQNMPAADAIQEMAIQTSNYAAEFGQAGGGLFNVTMKSGTNQYHGTVFEYFVNEDLNGAFPFSFNGTGGKYRPRNRRNDFGGTIGGPVIIPKVYDGRNKTFFFYSYEYYKEAQSLTFPDNLPNAQYQMGDFSAISPNGGANFNPALYGVPSTPIATTAGGASVFANEIFNPTTRTLVNGVGTAIPFSGNKIPISMIGPVATAIQGFLPTLSNGNPYNNYNGANIGQRVTSIPSIKIDQVLGSKQKLAFYYHHTNTAAQFTTPNGNADGLPDLLTGARGSIPIGGPTFRLNYDYSITPTLLAHIGGGYSMIYFYDDGPWTEGGKTVDCQAMLKISGCEGSFNFPTIIAGNVTLPNVLGGMQQLGNALAHTHTHTERPSSNANLTWVRGNHTYKAGMEVWWQAQITAPPTGIGLTYATLSAGGSGTVTNPGATAFPAALSTGAFQSGFPYANFLLDDVTAATQYAPVDARMFKTQFGMFVQDSWKATRKLTIDYGLRWDYATPASEEYGRSANLSLTTPNPAAGGHLGAPIFEATCNCKFVQAYPYAVGPRLGIAYAVNSKTVIRGGWGLAYAAPPDIGLQNTADLTNSAVGVNAFNPINAPGTIPQPTWPNFSVGQAPPAGQTSSLFLGYLDPGAARPARQNQWSIGVQREITPNTVLEAAYVGNRGVWWPGPQGFVNQVSPAAFAAVGLNPYTNPADDILLGSPISSTTVINRVGNIMPYTGYPTSSTLINALRPFPQFSTIVAQNSPTGRTFYDSLQMKGTHRLSHGLSVSGTFTWSKALVGIRPNLFVPSDKSLETTDQPFLFNTNIAYTTQRYGLISNRILSLVTRDWAVGAFLQYGSGLPLTPPADTNQNYIGGSEQFRVPGQPLFIKDLNCGCINPYSDVVLNPNAWANPAAGAFGPATGTLYGDFRSARRPQENINLGRTFRFREKMSFSIRAEFTNVFNRTQIGNPSTSAPAAATSHNPAGQLTGGFGTINEVVTVNTAPSYTQNAVVGQLYQPPRSGTLIVRFNF